MLSSFIFQENIMNQIFNVQGMTCGHCEKAVTRAVQSLDPTAVVKVELATGKVEVLSARPRDEIAKAIAEEGYPVAA